MNDARKIQKPDPKFVKAAGTWIQPEVPKEIHINNKGRIKTISITNSFHYNKIRSMKVLAPRSKWIRWEQDYSIEGKITFCQIAPYISRPRYETLELLCEYAKGSPRRFSTDFYHLFIWPANMVNIDHPFNTGKPRGGSDYGWDRRKTLKIRATAIELYVCFKYWVNIPPSEWHPEMKKYFNGEKNPIDATQLAMERHFSINLDSRKEKGRLARDTFYRNWVYQKRLLPLMKKHCKFAGYVPFLPYRNEL